jgi:hypothetical protein
MHHTLFEQLRVKTYLLQFYKFLTRGKYSIEESNEMENIIELNIDRLNLMKGFEWDGNYSLVIEQIKKTIKFIEISKENLKFKQICEDVFIAKYVEQNSSTFFQMGISLKDLKEILEIDVLFRNGHMLHNMFFGYAEKDFYSYQIDCLDFLHSASHFYNEAYEYYFDQKKINYNPNIDKKFPFDLKRIQPKEEVMFRNFRESFINIIFFIESFINSVGYDAYLNGIGKTNEEELHLKGIEKLNKKGFPIYPDLRNKIKNIVRVINNIEINTDSEPYKSYLEKSVELRNQYVHSSPNKPKILLGIDDWKEKCDFMINKECLEILTEFWKSCYPNKSFPKIIFNVFGGDSFKGHQGKFVITE